MGYWSYGLWEIQLYNIRMHKSSTMRLRMSGVWTRFFDLGLFFRFLFQVDWSQRFCHLQIQLCLMLRTVSKVVAVGTGWGLLNVCGERRNGGDRLEQGWKSVRCSTFFITQRRKDWINFFILVQFFLKEFSMGKKKMRGWGYGQVDGWWRLFPDQKYGSIVYCPRLWKRPHRSRKSKKNGRMKNC